MSGLGSISMSLLHAPTPPLAEMPFVMQNFFLIQPENWILGKAGLFLTFTSYPLPLHYYWSLMEILWNSVMKLRLRTQILMIIWFCSFKQQSCRLDSCCFISQGDLVNLDGVFIKFRLAKKAIIQCQPDASWCLLIPI